MLWPDPSGQGGATGADPGHRRGGRGRAGRQPGPGPGGRPCVAVEPGPPVGHPAAAPGAQGAPTVERQGGPCAPGGGERPSLLLLPTGLPARVPRGPRRRAGRHRAGRRGRAGRGSGLERPRPHRRPPGRADDRHPRTGPGPPERAGAAHGVADRRAGGAPRDPWRADREATRRRAVRPVPQRDDHPGAVRHRMASGGGGNHGAGRARAPGHRPGRHAAARGDGTGPEGAHLRLHPARGLGGGSPAAPLRFPACRPGGRAGLSGRRPALQRAGAGPLGGPGGLRRRTLGAGPALPGHGRRPLHPGGLRGPVRPPSGDRPDGPAATDGVGPAPPPGPERHRPRPPRGPDDLLRPRRSHRGGPGRRWR